jgi:hypothetical protein
MRRITLGSIDCWGLVTDSDCLQAIDQVRTPEERRDHRVRVWHERQGSDLVWGIEGPEQEVACYLLRHRLDRNYDLPKEALA